MGYFSNGTEGMAYEEQYCVRCVHYRENGEYNICPVWSLQIFWNYLAAKDPIKREALESFIPRRGTENLQCLLFIERTQK